MSMNGFDEAIRIACVLNPILKRGVAQLRPADREFLRAAFIGAQRRLADRTHSVEKRLAAVSEELDRLAQLGPVWQLVAAKIRESYSGMPSVGMRELATISLILGQVLEALLIENNDKVA